jgi:chorismate-pyruvate lyase
VATALGIASSLTLAAVPIYARPLHVQPSADAMPQSRESVLTAFERTLAQHDSATEALVEWCRTRGLAVEPAIRAEQLGGAAPHVMDDMRRVLRVGPQEPLGYRHVRLACGAHVLSDARNLYVPARLTPAMNAQLAGDRPFGAVVAPLAFRRERWTSRRGPDVGCPAETVLSQQALIRMADGTPLALVVECYLPAVLG